MSESNSSERTMSASRFKAECFAILDQVEQLRLSVTVTKRGRPIARVVPLENRAERRTVMGSVRLIAEDDAAYYSTSQRWATSR